MTYQSKSENFGFRELSQQELAVVSGGLVVNGTRGGDRWGWDSTPSRVDWEWLLSGYDEGQNDSAPAEGGESTGDSHLQSNGLSEEEEIIVKASVESLKNDIGDLIKKNGGDNFIIVVGEKQFSASQLVDSLDNLGKLLDAYEAYQIVDGLLSGDASVADALAFVAALAITFGVSAALGPTAGFLAGAAAGYLLPGAFNYVGNFLENAFDRMISEAANSTILRDSNPTAPESVQEYEFWRSIIPGLNNPYENNYIP
jgi:hypothetical protein